MLICLNGAKIKGQFGVLEIEKMWQQRSTAISQKESPQLSDSRALLTVELQQQLNQRQVTIAVKHLNKLLKKSQLWFLGGRAAGLGVSYGIFGTWKISARSTTRARMAHEDTDTSPSAGIGRRQKELRGAAAAVLTAFASVGADWTL